MKGWHFAAAGPNGEPALRDGSPARAGTVKVSGPLKLCVRGLHASACVIDALYYAPGPWLSRVELRGTVVMGDDKACAAERVARGYVDVTNVLREFAVRCAVRALEREQDAGREPDTRSWVACDLALGGFAGVVDVEMLRKAYNAAYAAADAAAYAADAYNAASAAAAAASAPSTVTSHGLRAQASAASIARRGQSSPAGTRRSDGRTAAHVASTTAGRGSVCAASHNSQSARSHAAHAAGRSG